jgi:muconolactone delta-isomerase
MTEDDFFDGSFEGDGEELPVLKTFMVSVKFSRITQEFAELVPKHRNEVNRLMGEGIITDYALAEDRSRLWMIVRAADEPAVYDILATLPLRKYMNTEVYELLFHNKAFVQFPAFSLN